jgi:hypothetical protein
MFNRYVFLSVISLLLATACGSKFSKKGSPPAATTNQNNHQAPPPIAPAAQNYNGNQLDPNTALNGQGQWVTVGDQRFFQPDRSRMQDPNDWQPYQDGRWSYDNQRGWTWVSAEPWGWLTDHYGVWRHHQRHGWIWMPFHDMQYQPHTVSWFDDGNYIGWYPYYPEYTRAYAFTDRHGFNDGYWQGRQSVLSVALSGAGFHIGFTLVNRSDATYTNIRGRMIRDRAIILNVARNSHTGDRLRRVGRHPGGHMHSSHDFVQRFSNHRAPIGDAQVVVSRGGARILQPFNGRHDRRDNDRRDGRDDDRRDGRDGRGDGRRDDQRGRPAVLPPNHNGGGIDNNNRGRPNPPPVQPPRQNGNGNNDQQRGRPNPPPVLRPVQQPQPPATQPVQRQQQQPRGRPTPAVLPPTQNGNSNPGIDQSRGRPNVQPTQPAQTGDQQRGQQQRGRPNGNGNGDRRQGDGDDDDGDQNRRRRG